MTSKQKLERCHILRKLGCQDSLQPMHEINCDFKLVMGKELNDKKRECVT